MNTKLINAAVDKHRDEILAAERYIWAHPETGYREWQTTAYLENIFEKAGYTLTKAGNIPGFYTDIVRKYSYCANWTDYTFPTTSRRSTATRTRAGITLSARLWSALRSRSKKRA